MKKCLKWMIILSLVILCSCTNTPPFEETGEEEITYIDPLIMLVPLEILVKMEETVGIISGSVLSVSEEIFYDIEMDYKDIVKFYEIRVNQVILGEFREQSVINLFEEGNGKTQVFSPTMKTGGYLNINDNALFILYRADEYTEEELEFNNLNHLIPMYGYYAYHGRIWLDENGEIDLERNAFEGSFVIQEESEMMYSSSEGRTTDSQEGTRTERQGETLDEFIGRIETALADERSVAEIAGDIWVGEARRE